MAARKQKNKKKSQTKKSGKKIHCLTENRKRSFKRIATKVDQRYLPVTVEDLALMLEIDLLLGKRKDFVKRLQKVIKALIKGNILWKSFCL